jgi:hypothetical protein
MTTMYGRTPERQAMLMVESFGIEKSIWYAKDALAVTRRGKSLEFWSDVYSRLKQRKEQDDPSAKAYDRLKDFVAEHRLQGTLDVQEKCLVLTLGDVWSKLLMAGVQAEWSVSSSGTPRIIVRANQPKFVGVQ